MTEDRDRETEPGGGRAVTVTPLRSALGSLAADLNKVTRQRNRLRAGHALTLIAGLLAGAALAAAALLRAGFPVCP